MVNPYVPRLRPLSATKQDVVLNSLSKTYLYSKVYVLLPTEFLVLFITVIVNEYSYSDRRNNTGWDICLIKFRYDIANTIFFETSETIVCTCSCATISSLHVYFLSECPITWTNHVFSVHSSTFLTMANYVHTSMRWCSQTRSCSRTTRRIPSSWLQILIKLSL